MTDITDRHTLRRMSWSELFTAAQDEPPRVSWRVFYL